jgi:hypothetical protein
MNPLTSSSKLFSLVYSVALAVSVVASNSIAASLPDMTPDGLKLLPDTKMAVVYAREGESFGSYDKVAILDCYVAFRKNWKRDQNSTADPFKVKDSDITRIRTQLAEEFKKVFAAELTAKGTTVVSEAGTNVLVLRPAIVNLDVAAPDTMDAGRQRSFSTSAGSMTLYLELYDGVSGELLARVIDPQQIEDYGYMRIRNSVTNRADADRVLKRWAVTAASYLQRARSNSVNP